MKAAELFFFTGDLKGLVEYNEKDDRAPLAIVKPFPLGETQRAP